MRCQRLRDSFQPLDREILVERYYEQITDVDAAVTLGLEQSAASKRYTRALERPEEILVSVSGEVSGEGS